MTAPDASLDLMASLVTDTGARWGDIATPEQWDDARAVLDPAGEPYNFLTRARGFSKTTDNAGFSLSVMATQLAPGSRLYALAADRDQGRLLTDAAAVMVANTPGLDSMFDVATYKITAKNGTVLEVLAADAPGAYGLRPSFLIVDELAQWYNTTGPRTLWEATTSAMAKVPGSRLVCLTSAGDPVHWSHKVIEHAKSDPLWRVHEIAGPPPWADPARLAEQRRRLPASVYARLFENQWTASEDRIASIDDLRACVRLSGPQEYVSGKRYVIGLDLGVRNDRTVAALCHKEPVKVGDVTTGAEVVLDRMQVWAGSKAKPVRIEDVEAWVAQAAEGYRAQVIVDPWQTIGLAQRLRDRSIPVEEFAFSAQSVGRLGSTLHLAIRNHQLVLPDDEELLDELANVRLRETSPGVLRIDHDPDRHDDRAIALALCAVTLLDRTAGRPEIVFGDDDPVALDGQPLQNLNGAFAMLPSDSFESALNQVQGMGW